MRVQTLDRRIAALLNDPLTSLMMRADGVDPARLAAQLRRFAEPPRAQSPRAQSSLGKAPARGVAETPWARLAGLSSALCGA
jgi:hypothetical protein